MITLRCIWSKIHPDLKNRPDTVILPSIPSEKCCLFLHHSVKTEEFYAAQSFYAASISIAE